LRYRHSKRKKKMSEKNVIWVDVDTISPDPNQPRTVFNDEEIASTAFTIESQGIINPIEIDENYVIVTGEIRWRAAQKAGMKRVPCIIWEDGTDKRFERQVVENLHHHQLSDRDREAAIVKLWKTEKYPNMAVLGKAVGLSRNRIGNILEANELREASKGTLGTGISTYAIVSTRGIEKPEQRIKILKSFEQEIIKSSEIENVVKLAKTSDALLDRVLDKQIPLDRALQAAETIDAIEKKGVGLTDEQKQNLADKVAEDETLLDKYKDAVLERVRQVATAPKKTKPTIEEPIGRTSPVNNIITVKNEVLDHFKIYLGNCDVNERRWAKKIMTEIRDELSLLIEMIHDE